MKEIPTIPVHEIMTALLQTEGGASLASTYRWDTFRDGKSDGEWRDILGATAVDSLHSCLMYGIGRVFLYRESGRFTSEQQEIFLYGLLAHDFGEAVVNGNGVGDVSAQIKTADHEKAESIIAREVIGSLSVDEQTKEHLLQGYAYVVEGEDPVLHRAFKALEKTEYVMTILKVFQNDRRRELSGQSIINNEKPMVGRVLVINLTQVLETYAHEYPDSIGAWVYAMAPLIDEAYANTEVWLRIHPWENTVPNHAALCDAFERKWGEFTSQGQ